MFSEGIINCNNKFHDKLKNQVIIEFEVQHGHERALTRAVGENPMFDQSDGNLGRPKLKTKVL